MKINNMKIISIPEHFFHEGKNEAGYLPMTASGSLRYSDEELEEFGNMLKTKIEDFMSDYILVKRILKRRQFDDANASPTFIFSDDAEDVYTREGIEHEALKLEKIIQELRFSLLRVANKTYGICCFTGRLIAKETLKKYPNATFSLENTQHASQLN